ncbi:uncharacterized protein C8A04DRAFT_16078 [Dichotomopilus funicola]|uniref:JmjC domain-containing protein n=1 Tax=Dichotomopilus funicola TaxID=1934379 RepID=A0AAN6ZIV1_9PEZI|nr:hypothetical protein C8A04DRAFT_16078 [Dichotomopilus funicola]
MAQLSTPLPPTSEPESQATEIHLDADLDDESFTLPPEQASQTNRFREELRTCETDMERYELCVQKRDELLNRHAGLQLLISTCELIMSTECPTYQRRKRARRGDSGQEDDAEQWHRFLGLATEGDRIKSNCLSALKEVARCWGRQVTQHYHWASRREKYCNQLRAAARKVPQWDNAVTGLNWSILQRSENVRRRPVKASVNPIEQQDLEYLKTWSQRAPFENPLPINHTPHGLGFDRFGLLVHKEFALILPQVDGAGSIGLSASLEGHFDTSISIHLPEAEELETSNQTSRDPISAVITEPPNMSSRRRRSSLSDIAQPKRPRIDTPLVFTGRPGASEDRPAQDHTPNDAYRRRVLAELEQATPLPGSHGEVTNHLLRELLVKVQHPNTGSSRGAVEAFFCTGDEAAHMVETQSSGHSPIITKDQQPFQWGNKGRPIEQFLRRFCVLDLTVSVQIPSHPSTKQSFEARKLGEVKERFLNGEDTSDPWNILDLQSPIQCIHPKFLTGENCGLFYDVRNSALMEGSAERVTASPHKWTEWKDVDTWALLSEGGHHTAPHMDSHGYSTWITCQEGFIGFGWMSCPTEEEREGWMAEPHRYTGGRWRYIILKPGQTVFFGPGTIHFVFRARAYQTLGLGGHILLWSGIEWWIRIVLAELKNPAITNEEMKKSAPKLVRAVTRLVEAKVNEGRKEELGGEDAVNKFFKSVKVRSYNERL